MVSLNGGGQHLTEKCFPWGVCIHTSGNSPVWKAKQPWTLHGLENDNTIVLNAMLCENLTTLSPDLHDNSAR